MEKSHLVEEQVHVFSGFPRRGTAYRDICAQAKIIPMPWALVESTTKD